MMLSGPRSILVRRGYWGSSSWVPRALRQPEETNELHFISISTILSRASTQYGRSYLYTETDGNDATYFVIYQLEVILSALKAIERHLERHLQEKTRQIEEAETLLKDRGDFNHRQLALLSHALRNPDAEFTIQSHRVSHGVAYATARADLLNLVTRGLLEERKIGRAAHFFPGRGFFDLVGR